MLASPAIAVREAVDSEAAAVRAVYELAFGTRAEADLVEALAAEGFAAASLVAVVDGDVVGHVLLSVLDAPMPALALAPLAVRPADQRRGIGSRLVEAALSTAEERGWAAVLVLGDPQFYGRLGFSADAAAGYRCKYAGDHLMLKVLGPSVPSTGAILYPAPFDGLER